jgi:hypothetical protein
VTAAAEQRCSAAPRVLRVEDCKGMSEHGHTRWFRVVLKKALNHPDRLRTQEAHRGPRLNLKNGR